MRLDSRGAVPLQLLGEGTADLKSLRADTATSWYGSRRETSGGSGGEVHSL